MDSAEISLRGGTPLAGRRLHRRLVIDLTVELAIVVVGFAIYRAGRGLTSDSVVTARRNALELIEFERDLGLFHEPTVQRAVLGLGGAIEALNRYYVYVHFPATALFLTWVFVLRRHRYAVMRNWIAGVTFAGLVLHIVYPLAPPRMFGGFVDTLRVFGPGIYPADPSRSAANQFAAMPSLHFAWALIVGLGMMRLTGRHSRWWMAHPAVTLLAIVATGNHYWTDAAVATTLVVAVAVVVRRWERRSDPVLSARPAAEADHEASFARSG